MKKHLLILTILLAAISTYAQIPTDGLVGYWPFNGNGNDESGNGHNGIVSGAQLANDRYENPNSAYFFSNNGDRITTPNTSSFNFIDEEFTISLFLFVDDEYETGKNRIVSNGSTQGFGWELVLNPSLNAIEFITNQNQSGLVRQISISNSIDYTQWYHVVVTRDGSTVIIYLNAVDETNVSALHMNPATSNLPLTIGAYPPAPGSGYDFKGKVDNLAIFNRLLSAVEIQALYSGETPLNQFCKNIYCTGENVGIGTDIPDSKLTVNGTIHTKEVRVDLDGFDAPDFVFEENYDLSTLEETAQYIQNNKHLPNIPSASEMEAYGVNLKELNLKLLQKIEELTLHLIEQNRHLLKQDRTIEELQNQIKDLQSLKTE